MTSNFQRLTMYLQVQRPIRYLKVLEKHDNNPSLFELFQSLAEEFDFTPPKLTDHIEEYSALILLHIKESDDAAHPSRFH